MVTPTPPSSFTPPGFLNWSVAAGWVCLVWYTTVLAVCALGCFEMYVSVSCGLLSSVADNCKSRWKHFLRKPGKSASSTFPSPPHVTLIRPVKGLEPHLYDCLASTFRQDYPSNKLTVYFCVASKSDPAYPTLKKLVDDFPGADVCVLVEEDDPLLQPTAGNEYSLGPNPKIRNMSRAYREAKGDIVWIIDCNVWIGRGVCGRMVDRLCGLGGTGKRKYKFVHHLPVVVDVTGEVGEQASLLGYPNGSASAVGKDEDIGLLATGGGRLEELFLSSAHAKMYTAINTVLLAPCIVGKSNMFRRSHLDYLTSTDPQRRNPGIDFFSDNICEDHLIGDLLWKNKVREEKELGERWGKHAMVFGDLAFQPVADMSVQSYIARRVRWLRVRKFTVLLATLVEPGTESFLCSLYGAWGVTTALAEFLGREGYGFAEDLTTWTAFFTFFFASMLFWVFVDWTLYINLHSAKTVEVDEDTPYFARPIPKGRTTRRPFLHWFAAWLGREGLALPIWFRAVYGGVTVAWRDRQFRVGFDAKVREIEPSSVRLEGSYSSGAGVGAARRRAGIKP